MVSLYVVINISILNTNKQEKDDARFYSKESDSLGLSILKRGHSVTLSHKHTQIHLAHTAFKNVTHSKVWKKNAWAHTLYEHTDHVYT